MNCFLSRNSLKQFLCNDFLFSEIEIIYVHFVKWIFSLILMSSFDFLNYFLHFELLHVHTKLLFYYFVTWKPLFDASLMFHWKIQLLYPQSLLSESECHILFQTDNMMDDLTPGLTPSNYRGEIIVALKFVPPESQGRNQYHQTSSSLTTTSWKNGRKYMVGGGGGGYGGVLLVLIKEAKNLVSSKGIPDPFCKW